MPTKQKGRRAHEDFTFGPTFIPKGARLQFINGQKVVGECGADLILDGVDDYVFIVAGIP